VRSNLSSGDNTQLDFNISHPYHLLTMLTTAAPCLALLREDDPEVKRYALTSLNEVVDQFWAEIANEISQIEELYEDESFKDRQLAALLASKVYYNLGDYDSSVKYSLSAGSSFNIDEKSEFVETIVSKCIDLYIEISQSKFLDPEVVIDSQLESIFEMMLQKCVQEKELKLALGISLESYRLDIVEKIIHSQISELTQEDTDDGEASQLINYVLTCATTVVKNIAFKVKVLNSIVLILRNLPNPDYFIITKIIVQLNDHNLAHQVFVKLLSTENYPIAYQAAFDLVSSASQELLIKTTQLLTNDSSIDASSKPIAKLLKVLSGVPTCDLDITFLYQNNNTDKGILDKTKATLDARNSLFHSAVTFSNAFLHAGTTDDSFFRNNLEWLGKATNWSKFSASAAFGVIHKGNLLQGRTLLQPYLPENNGSPYTKSGSLFGLGLIYAGHGKEVLDYLRGHLLSGTNNADNSDFDVLLHGAALAVGVAGMGSNDEEVYEELKTVLYTDSAVSGQAAALSMGLVMLGSGNQQAIDDMLHYAEETQHETIIRGLAVSIALLCYAKEDAAEPVIAKLLVHQNALLRYGGVFALALAYCGTSNNSAIQRLLHIAVSDSSDNVRRVSVIALGFILLREYTTVTTLVELLAESHNPHVRYGTAMAVGIACAGRGLNSAIEFLEPLTKDPVDFVRQGAFVALSMILIQQNEKTCPKVKQIREKLAKVIDTRMEESLAKFGAVLAQGIIDAGGRNVTIQLENSQTGTLNLKSVVGLAVFVQSWYWFPFSHFLSLSFTPTSIIGVRDDFKVPKFKINCHTSEDLFSYPPKVEEAKTKQTDKLATAILSTTVRAKARAKKRQEKESDAMDIDKPDEEFPAVKEETKDNEETNKKLETTTSNVETEQPTTEEFTNNSTKTNFVSTPYQIDNMSRVVPAQLKYISFIKDERYQPVRKFRGTGGIVVLHDSRPDEPADTIKTVRQLTNKNAPLPAPFTLEEEDE